MSEGLSSDSAVQHRSTMLLKAWGCFRNGEIGREVGIKQGIKPASGQALEADPVIPHIRIAGAEARQIGDSMHQLSEYSQWAIKQVYLHEREHLLRSKHFRDHLRSAIKEFSVIHKLA